MNQLGKILGLLLIFATDTVLCQEIHSLRFFHFSVEDGLSHGSVNTLLRDSQGFMWIGTSDGLNRYEGYESLIFEHVPGDPFSLSANTVTTLMESPEGDIWIGTSGGGISIYHPQTEVFSHYRHNPSDSSSLSNDYVNIIYRDREGTIWVGTNLGLNRFIPGKKGDTGSFTVFSSRNSHLSNNTITTLWQDPAGVLWAGTENGLNLLRFQPHSPHPQITGFNRDTTHSFRLKSLNIKQLYEDPLYPGRILWVATRQGLHRIALDSLSKPVELIYFTHNPDDPVSISEEFVTSVVRDETGTLWAGTRGGGLNQFIEDSLLHFVHYLNDPNDPFSLGGDRVVTLFSDNMGLLWAGLETNGISRLVIAQGKSHVPSEKSVYRQFQHHLSPEESPQNLYANVITALYEDRRGVLWIGTEGSGCRKVAADGAVTFFFPDARNPFGLSHSIVTTFTEDPKGNLWVGTFGGLNKYLPEKEGFIRYFAEPDKPGGLNNQRIFATFFDEEGILWLGTRGGGLNRFDPATEIFTAYRHDPGLPQSISNDHVWTLEPEGKHQLWVGTDEGLNLFDKRTGTFRNFTHQPGNPTSLSNNFINILFRDRKGTLWIGTDGGGINQMIKEGEQVFFRYFSKKDGLPDNVIYGIEEDLAGNLWISTNKGLSRFSTETNSATYSAFKNYDLNDGLQDNEFNIGAHFRSPSGKMYFGGMNGYNSFFPAAITGNPFPPEVVITRLKILNETVFPGKKIRNGNIPLKQTISKTSQLNLTYRDYVVSLEFAALNYVFPRKNRYAYKLEGFDENWIYTGDERKATYTNLDPGDYVFRVKACNNDGLWNETGASLFIHVSPPPWKTGWAYLLYIVFSGMLLAAFIYYRDQSRIRLEKARTDEREQVRKNAAADFHDELGNKLTKISLFLELAKRQASLTQRPLLQKVETNVQTLSEGVRDLIWVLDPEKDSLYDTLVHLKDFGDALFEQTDITFRTEGIRPDLEKIKIPLSTRRHLVLLFKEAMNNSLKYAGGNEVFFRANHYGERLTLSFQDRGKGLGEEVLGTGYGLKNMRERAQKIGATLKIESLPEGGTLVELSLILPH
ncbi:MAG: two-component regulator propeller domain-containing protein [Bacteroidia bacterium]|nr:two-component regulator propeller domain-containing protein [Bacteroidia bacterium]